MAEERVRLMPQGIRPIGMCMQGFGVDAEAQLRAMCNGALPVVGQRYVWLCTAVQTDADPVYAHFTLIPVDE
jgi:hypothetical protein